MENARAKTNTKAHPDLPLGILSGNKTHCELPSDRLTLPPQQGKTLMTTVRISPMQKENELFTVQQAAVGVYASCIWKMNQMIALRIYKR